MKIKIRFENRNTSALGIRVYRDTTHISRDNLPPVYAAIAGDATEFIDENAIQDTTYYYVLEPFSDNDSTFSANITAVAGEFMGPGPKVLKRGDLNIGYFGRVPGSDFINYNALIALANIPGTVNSYLTNTDDEWLKVAYKGKILFIAKRPIIHVRWDQLYAAGLIYGVDGPGPREFNTLPEVNQLRKVTIKNTEFIIRSMTSAPDGIELPTSISSSHNTSLIRDMDRGIADDYGSFNSYNSLYDLTGSEWNDIMYKFFSVTPPDHKGPKFELLDIELAAMFTGTSSRYGLENDGIFQNRISSTQFLSRCSLRSSSSNIVFPGYAVGASISNSLFWRPVLEMIP